MFPIEIEGLTKRFGRLTALAGVGIRIGPSERVALYGYGVDDPRGRSLSLGSLDTYLYYVRKLGNEHLSLLLFAVFAIVLSVAIVVTVRRQGSVRGRGCSAGSAMT